MTTVRSASWLEERRDEWDALARLSSNPLLEADWILSGAGTLFAAADVRLATVERGGRLAAATALVAPPKGWFAPLECAGMAALYEPGGLLHADAAALDELVRELVRLGRPLLLARLPAESEVAAGFQRAVHRPGVVLVRPTASSLVVPLSGSWDDYERRLSSRLTSNLRRLARRAARAHPVRTEVVTPAPGQVSDLFATFMQVEASGWKGRQASSLLARANLRAFFARYLERAAERSRLRVARLWFGDRLAAAEIALVAYNRWWQLKIGFDDQCAELYPGLQLTHASVRHAFDQGLDAYEFLALAADWERRWNPEERRFVTLLVYPATVMGALGLGAAVTRRVTGRLTRMVGGPSRSGA